MAQTYGGSLIQRPYGTLANAASPQPLGYQQPMGPQISPLQAYMLYQKFAGPASVAPAAAPAAPATPAAATPSASSTAASSGLSGAGLAGAVAAPLLFSAIWAGKDILGKKGPDSGNAYYKILKALGF